MPGRDIIVIGASAGGVEALSSLVRSLPADLPAAVFVVVHIAASATSVLPRIMSRAGPLPAAHPKDGEELRHGRIYVAPPDHHLLVRRGTVGVTRGPRENRQRPAVDPLFRTAARWYGRRVVGVILSGALDDGTAGLHVVRMREGLSVVQDPADALFDSMPRSAIVNAGADFIVPVAEMAPVLSRLACEPVVEEEVEAVNRVFDIESEIPVMDPNALLSEDRPGISSGFSCPECGGVLFELNDGDVMRFRCRVGHALSVESLLAEQSEALEAAFWIALRGLEERAALARKLARRSRERGQTQTAERFDEDEREAQQQATIVRRVLKSNGQRATPSEESSRASLIAEPD